MQGFKYGVAYLHVTSHLMAKVKGKSCKLRFIKEGGARILPSRLESLEKNQAPSIK